MKRRKKPMESNSPKLFSFEDFLDYIHPEEGYKLDVDIMYQNGGILIDMDVLQDTVKPEAKNMFIDSSLLKATWESHEHPFMRKTTKVFESTMYYRITYNGGDKNGVIDADLAYIPEHSPITPAVIRSLNLLDYYTELGMGINLEILYP
jgi:hypothetical protein